MDLYAVVGNPVSHSKSPEIHSLFAEQTGQNLTYSALQAPLKGFPETVARFFEAGGKGLNVTVPFKEAAWQLSVQRSKQSQLAGATNTLYLQGKEICGDNTDGAGLVRDLTINQGFSIEGKKILVLGAGGAVRGVLLPLLEQQPESIVIANRTLARAEQLAQLFADFGSIDAMAYDSLDGVFDLIINGTSASLEGSVPSIPVSVLGSGAMAYDMMYNNEQTPFCHWASSHGAAASIDGLGMLVEQAAESFYIWRGVRPDTKSVLQYLKGDT